MLKPHRVNIRKHHLRQLRAMLALTLVIAMLGVYLGGRIRLAQALSLTMIGVPVTQNFDTLATSGTANGWTDDTTLPGWYSQFSLLPASPTTYRADAGGSNTGAIYSWGTGTSTERAFGSVASGTPGDIFNALKLTNNTGVTITSLDISYTGEQWRNGGNTSAQQLDFQYQVASPGTITDANTPTTGWTDFDALDFVSPVTGATAAALDGNAAANRTAKSANLPVTVAVGQEIWIRWKDTNDAGNDHGLGIDDFSVTPNVGLVIPTLNINDVSQAEGNSGASTFTFTVSLTSPANPGGVTFDIATQDNTATVADNDYVPRTLTGQTIPSGSTSYTFDVNVNGDTTTEPNESFFVNVTNITGANAGDTQGLGTINNDDVTLTSICQIQGNGSTSPVVGSSVNTTGIVTGLKQGSSGGFYIQDDACDADPSTSNGIFVFTGGSVPPAVAIGNQVQVSGTVQEFIPSADPNQRPLTEIGGSPTTILLSTGNPLPAPVSISAADTQVNNLENLERLEGMRVQVDSLTVVGPTQGSITEPSATVSSNGVFFGVVSGVPRPFREPGVNISNTLPAGSPPNVPRFDENPERIRVDSDAQPGTTALDVAAGTILSNLIGEMDYAFRAWTILPEAATPPGVGSQPGSTPVPARSSDEFTVASFNMERFFDTVDDPATSDPVLTAAAYNRRLNKASLIIRTVQGSPDIIGVEEMENLTTLQDVATRINTDAGTPNDYQAYLVEGNDIGGIDVGFLVRSSRVNVIDVTQVGKDTTYINPNNGQPELLNDRPPLVLRVSVQRPGGTFTSFTVIVNHLRSLNGVDDPVDGNRVRTKRRAQAEFLANLIQTRQSADPNEKIITVGDMNAFRVNDGYVDLIGTILGTPTPPDQVVLASSDLVNPDQTDLVDILSPAQRYSYNFDGNAQTLDHIIVNPPALAILTRFAYARNDSDFPVKNYESTNELRISDHDQPVAYFSLAAPTAANGIVSGRITTTNGVGVAGTVVNLAGTQTRKTITDANGNYHFDGVETGGFYTVTPSRANFSFSPATRAFSQLSERTEAAFTASSSAETANPLDTPEYFVRQQYLDLLGREPDEGGFNYWSDQLLGCGSDALCMQARRRDVAAAFFIEAEFQRTGSYLYGLYKGALGRQPLYQEFASDRQQVVDGPTLEQTKQQFAESFVSRAEFVSRYQSSPMAELFVDALLENVRQTSGLDLSSARPAMLSRYNAGGNVVQSRSLALRTLTESGAFQQAQYNSAFVLTEYFGYLRRDPDLGGYEFWLDVLNNRAAGDYRSMVCAFITSAEYQRRFSTIISHSNRDCGP